MSKILISSKSNRIELNENSVHFVRLLKEPAVYIAADVNPFCAGETVTFTPTLVCLDDAVSYSWIVESVEVSTSSAPYSTNTLVDGNRVILKVVNSLGQSIYSNMIIVQEKTEGCVFPFITEWLMTNGSFTLPLANGYSYDAIVDWGDGSPMQTITAYNDTNATHIYSPGTYQIKISGICQGFSINNNATIRGLLKKVIAWGNSADFRKLDFYGCNNLTSIPDYSITGADNITNFYRTFQDCSNLTGSIPADLFRYNTLVSTSGFRATFRGCSNLTGSIPVDLFRYNTQVSTNGFYQTFYNCSGLTGPIPVDLFRYNTQVSTSGFQGTFLGCSNLTGSIPVDLFRYNTQVSTSGFYGTLRGCSNLTGSIPVDLFRYNTQVSTNGFTDTFLGCSNLTGSIPADLFRYNTLVSTSGFHGTFSGCSNLTGSIPVDLFRYNTQVSISGFNQTFYNCSGLTGSIPADLFRYNTQVSTLGFYGTFLGCSNLTGSIPDDLFRYNTQVSTDGFYQTFFGCINLTEAPDGLFKYNTLVSTDGFNQTFYNCPKLKLNPYIFYDAGQEATFFASRNINFYQCFFRTSFTGTQGTAPELWNCTFNTVNSIECFAGNGNSLTSLTNYNDIPAGWK